MPRGVRHQMHSGVSSIALIGDMTRETIAKPSRIGVDSHCGLPGCASIRAISLEYPPDIAAVYPQAAWDHFLTQINQVLTTTSVPDCPCFLTACLPPACLLFWWCRKARTKDRVEAIQDLVEVENDRLLHQGLVWTEPIFTTDTFCGIRRIPQLRSSIKLQMDVVKRTEYELDNPQATQFLANKLLERSERHHETGAPLTPVSRALQSEMLLDDAQQKLLTRQVTLHRRNSLQTSTSRTHETPQDPTMTPATANERWAEPVKPATFRAIVPGETNDQSGQAQPNQQTMQ